MPAIGSPDLLGPALRSRALAGADTALQRASRELTTGLRENIVEASGGDPFQLYQLDRELDLNAVFQTNITLAAGRAETSQAALQQASDAIAPFGAALLGAVTSGDQVGAAVRAGGARAAFEDVVRAINTRFADRGLFAGAAVDRPALAGADEILAEVAARVAPAADASDAIAAIDDYFFTDPTGFAADGFTGDAADAPAAELAQGLRLNFAVRGDAPEIRAALAALAVAVIGAEGGYAGESQAGSLVLLGEAANRALSATDGLTGLRSELGVAEARIEEYGLAAEAEKVTLEGARSRILARDPFDAATEFTALETQVQTLLSVTARLSTLNLSNFLR